MKEDGTVPTPRGSKRVWEKGGYANTEIPTTEQSFLPNCLIVLAGQAGGSKPHLASGKKKKEKKREKKLIYIMYESIGVGASIKHAPTPPHS